jgi:hypothetical protein
MIVRKFSGVLLSVAALLTYTVAVTQEVTAPEPQPAIIVGTVTDVTGAVVPGATVDLIGSSSEELLVTTADGNGFFQFPAVSPGVKWRLTIHMQGFADWTSNTIEVRPGQYFFVASIQLRPAIVDVTVTAITQEQLAIQEVRSAEKQRVLGIIPNFYVVYDRNPAPLSPKLKFQLATKALTDRVTIAGFALNAAIYQAADYPGYRGGMEGYGQRLGATFAGGYTNILLGDALLPSVLHQDPRYYYKGTGTTRSRVLHAISYPFVTHGDNGRREINLSGIGGDLAAGAIANAYYPPGERGEGLAFRNALIGAGGRLANGLVQEFVLHRPMLREKR